jgi:hypothetical protein
MSQNLNINQQGLLPIPGQIDIATMRNGIITCMVDPSQATALVAGQFVQFYSSNTLPYPTVIAAPQNGVAHGLVAYVVKDASFNARDKLNIAFFGGLVVWVQATAVALTPGQQVESDSTGVLVQAHSSNPVRGYMLDYTVASGMGRMIQLGLLNAQ